MRSVRTTALVIGAGPAGACAAFVLARAGVDTILVDRAAFPRDKVCGDALIPDALRALRSLGLYDRVIAHARTLNGIHIHAPNGRRVTLGGECASVPRRVLDDILREAAVDAGAQFWSPYVAKAPIGNSAVAGAILEHAATGECVHIEARITLLATGAGVDGISRFGVLTRRDPSAVAARAYFEVPAAAARQFDHLCISYDRAILPGYGWVFPGPNGFFNIGVGAFVDARRARSRPGVAELWTRFSTGIAPVRRLLENARQASPLRGAPLRTAMRGSLLARPGLLVVGEAAGLTYSFSGEGIGKAIESGLLAAELIVDAASSVDLPTDVAQRYTGELTARFAPRFNAYAIAQRWLESARLANFVASRAGRSVFVRQQLEGLFTETTDPTVLFSLSGLVRSLVS